MTGMPPRPSGDQSLAAVAHALRDIAEQAKIANMIEWRKLKITTLPNTEDDFEIERRLGLGRKRR